MKKGDIRRSAPVLVVVVGVVEGRVGGGVPGVLPNISLQLGRSVGDRRR